MNNDLTPKQQTSEAIRQADSILIITGQHPSVDQAASVIALAAILRKFGKKVSAVVSDSLPAGVSFLDAKGLDRSLSGLRDFILHVDARKAQVDKLRYEVENDRLNVFITPFRGSFAPSDVTFDYGDFHYDLVIVLGVPTRARLDRIYEQNQTLFTHLPIINIDFHRSNENYGAVNLIEGYASSLAEILVALAESLQSGMLDEDIATALLTGLMASTDRFTATHTTSKSLTVGAQLMAAGARQQAVVRGLYAGAEQPRREDTRPPRNDRPERNDQTDRPRDGRPQASREAVRDANQSNDARPAQSQPNRVEATKLAEEPVTAPQEVQEISVQSEQLPPTQPTMEPIIAPGHIELSEPDDELIVQDDATPEAEPIAAIPMADFAAAGEILTARPLSRDDLYASDQPDHQ